MNPKINRIRQRKRTDINHSIGNPPKDESDNVKRKWRRLVSIIDYNLNRADRHSFLNLARSLVALDDLESEIRENGRFVIAQTGAYMGSYVISPIETHRIKAEQQCLQLLREFNLTPKSLAKNRGNTDDKSTFNNIFGA